MSTAAIKAALRDEGDDLIEKAVREGRMLNSGCTLLNLACSGNPFGAFAPGGYYLIWGDSTSGKTVLGGTCFAEACLDKRFDKHIKRFDNVENGALMFEKFFGAKIAEQIKPPFIEDDGSPGRSNTIEDFYFNLHRCLEKGPTIYLLDSENALSSEAELKKQKQKRKAMEDDTEVAGTMTDSKAKVHSQNLRGVCGELIDTDSILIMLSQSRDNMGFGAQYEPKTRSGGRALKFYAMLEMQTSVFGHIKKTVRGAPREIGVTVQVRIRKNRFTGKDRTVLIPIYHNLGFDDLGSCVDYLVKEKHWSATEGTINAPELHFKGSREKLVGLIEDKGYEAKLRALTGRVWNEIEAACEVSRKSRYK